MRSIYCFAPNAGWNNQQLVKNCGALPLIFHKYFGFRAVMVGGKCDTYPNLDMYLHGVEMDFYASTSIDSKLDYIRQNADCMDVMVLHGYADEYILLVREYKKLNPSGKVYMETDANGASQDRLLWYGQDYQELFGYCDVIGVSCRKMHQFLNRKWNYTVDYLPNGFYNFLNIDMTVDFSKKENTILTVGRIGTAQKNNEMLIEAFSRVYRTLPDWRVQLVGTITDGFLSFLQGIFEKYPGIDSQIIISGSIADKNALMTVYKTAKIFTLTSIFEGGTPNVVAEALFSGCHILCSDIDGAADATASGRCGDVFAVNDVRQLSELLIHRCNDAVRLTESGKAAIEYAKMNFDYVKIMSRLYYLLFGEVADNGIC